MGDTGGVVEDPMPSAAPLPPKMDADTFLEWCTHQEDRYELVDGRPVLMTGATRRHDRIVVNLLSALNQRLRGGPCAPSTADVASRMARGSVRRPDVTVDCGPFAPAAVQSAEPAVFFEVLSPSTRGADLVRKANEYRLLPSLRAFVILEPDRAEVSVWTRGDDGDWAEPERFDTTDAVLALPAIGAELPLSEIYDGVPLED